MIDNTIKIVDALSRFFAGIGWPLVCIITVIFLAPALRDLISRIDKLTGKVAGQEFSLTTLQRNSANQIAAATVAIDNKARIDDPARTVDVNRQFASSLNSALQATSRIQVDRTVGKRILWVDDNPTNNIFEKQSLIALGMTVRDVTDTQQAIDALVSRQYDVVISDMRRGGNNTAGYDLLQMIKDKGIATPVIFYAASANERFIAEAKRRGAFGETNNPEQLVLLVAGALGALL